MTPRFDHRTFNGVYDEATGDACARHADAVAASSRFEELAYPDVAHEAAKPHELDPWRYSKPPTAADWAREQHRESDAWNHYREVADFLANRTYL